jgi:hypothetical protein
MGQVWTADFPDPPVPKEESGPEQSRFLDNCNTNNINHIEVLHPHSYSLCLHYQHFQRRKTKKDPNIVDPQSNKIQPRFGAPDPISGGSVEEKIGPVEFTSSPPTLIIGTSRGRGEEEETPLSLTTLKLEILDMNVGKSEESYLNHDMLNEEKKEKIES